MNEYENAISIFENGVELIGHDKRTNDHLASILLSVIF